MSFNFSSLFERTSALIYEYISDIYNTSGSGTSSLNSIRKSDETELRNVGGGLGAIPLRSRHPLVTPQDNWHSFD
jgi:hypothetical protein